MTSENVAVDDRDEDEDEALAGRPIGAQLAVLGERAVDFPADMLIRLGQEAGAVYLGALLLISKWRLWQTDAAQRHRLDDASAVAKAAGGKLPLAHEELSLKRQAQRARLTAVVAVVTALGLTAASIVSVSWGYVQWLGVAGACGMLWAAHEYKLRVFAALAPLPVAVVLLLGVDQWRWWPAAVAVGTVALVCEQIGMRWRPPTEAKLDGRPRAGVSFPKLWETIRLRLLELRITATRRHIRPIVVGGREVGVAFGVTTREEVTDEAIHAVARELHLGANLVRWTLSAKEPVGELIVYFEDTLTDVPSPPAVPFGELRYSDRISLGGDDDGTPAGVVLAYTHMLVFGDTGSGKSSVLRLLIDAVETMPDAEVWGIDLAGGSLLGAQRRRLGRGRVAIGPQEIKAADAILDTLLAEAAKRNAIVLDGEDYDEDGVVDDRFLVDDRDGRRAKVLFVGEYTAFCRYPPLVKKLIDLGDISRKGAINIVVETPSLAKDRLHDGRAFLAIAMVIIAMACSLTDVVQALGPGKVEQGWRPDRLQPESEGRRNDAGRGYIHGGGRNLPRLTGFHPMNGEQAAERRRRRRVERDRWYGHVADPVDPAVDEPEVIDAEIVDPSTVDAIEAIEAVLAVMGDRTVIPVKEATSGLASRVAVDALRGAVKPGSLYSAETGGSVWGYGRNALLAALNALSGGPMPND